MLLKNTILVFFCFMKFANIAEKITYPNNAGCMYLMFSATVAIVNPHEITKKAFSLSNRFLGVKTKISVEEDSCKDLNFLNAIPLS